jgi:antitoxin component of MazEF toxin-antitoxin module
MHSKIKLKKNSGRHQFIQDDEIKFNLKNDESICSSKVENHETTMTKTVEKNEEERNSKEPKWKFKKVVEKTYRMRKSSTLHSGKPKEKVRLKISCRTTS